MPRVNIDELKIGRQKSGNAMIIFRMNIHECKSVPHHYLFIKIVVLNACVGGLTTKL